MDGLGEPCQAAGGSGQWLLPPRQSPLMSTDVGEGGNPSVTEGHQSKFRENRRNSLMPLASRHCTNAMCLQKYLTSDAETSEIIPSKEETEMGASRSSY